MSIQLEQSHLEQAYPDILAGIGMLIQKGKLSTRFESVQLAESEFQQLEKAKELCELKIIEFMAKPGTLKNSRHSVLHTLT